jgi:tetrapyrrole methylase family protein / MazG family protein
MAKIDVLGLGAGDIDQLPFGIYKRLKNMNGFVFTRTLDHPVIPVLKEEGVDFQSFDHLYEEEETFEVVYKRIVSSLIEAAKESAHIVYTVPGHPMLAERTVQLLLEQDEVDINVSGGQSYLDDLFTALKIDPIEGFQFLDGSSFERSDISYRGHLVFCQVYDQFIASNVKLALLEDLPPDFEVTIVEAAGSERQEMKTVPLAKLDHQVEISNLTSVYVPPVPIDLLNHTFDNLREVIRRLRAPGGCPWDREQTHESLRAHSIEEIYELIEAIDNQDDDGIMEELGDIFMHVVLHSQIGEDDGYFTVDDVIRGVTNKMIFRHPHVFGDVSVGSSDEVVQNWEELKKQEKGEKRKSVLDGVPKPLPALLKAYKVQKKAAKVGFDWDQVSDIWAKLDEEIKEAKEAIEQNDREEMEIELGDVLFVLANLTRFYKINPEIALERTNQKFISRFTYIEEKLKHDGVDIDQASLEVMDKYWNQAKERE